MAEIIVTDLTHFENKDIVCIAGICTTTGECIRPMPYIKIRDCERLKILPGARLSGDFSASSSLVAPHTEDRKYQKLKYLGPCTPEAFQGVLQDSLSQSVCEGFGVQLEFKQKHIPIENALSRSIITIGILPRNVELVEDGFRPGKIRLSFVDNDGMSYKYWPITDLGFYKYLREHMDELHTINRFIHNQRFVYLRVGLTREYAAKDGRNGYWLQINGIYTFPEYHEGIRLY